MAEKSTKDPFTFDPETVARHFRLQRALSDPDLLEEFLASPKEVGKRYDVTLSDAEITAIRNAGQFLASWNLFCGEGQWVEASALDRRGTRATSASLPEMVARRVRERVAAEITSDIPEAIHGLVSRVGGSIFSDPSESLEDLPEHVQPLARTIRRLERSVSQELAHGLQSSAFSVGMRYPVPWTGFQPAPVTSSPQPPQPAVPPASPYGNGVENLSAALAARANELVTRAVTEAVEQVRPGLTRPFAGQTHRPRMEQSQPKA